MRLPTGQPGERIKARRHMLGLSQRDLAKMCGMTQGAIAHLETGRNNAAECHHIVDLAAALLCTVQWIQRGGEHRAPPGMHTAFITK